MRAAAAVLLVATLAACGTKAKKKWSEEDHRKACDAARLAGLEVHTAFGSSWALHAQDRTPAGLCASIANEAKDLEGRPAAFKQVGDDQVLDRAAQLFEDVSKAAAATAECTKNPEAFAEKLADMADKFDSSLDSSCPPAAVGAGTPK